MKQVFTRLRRPESGTGRPRSVGRVFAGALLVVPWWVAAVARRAPGLVVRWRSAVLGLSVLARRGWSARREARELLLNPMDSFRYFEFDFVWRRTRRAKLGTYLDVSSPRLFTGLLLAARGGLFADIANPDRSDLDQTRALLKACGLERRARLHPQRLESLPFGPATYDTIISISVVEHIPDDRQAVAALWKLLRPGGRLVLTVPCAAEAMEEFIDFNEYGLLASDQDGFVFGQRLYDQRLLEERVWAVTGRPETAEIYGEKRAGAFLANRAAKLAAGPYPFWREPYMMAVEYGRFSSLASLPGWGVIGMEFVKRGTTP